MNSRIWRRLSFVVAAMVMISAACGGGAVDLGSPESETARTTAAQTASQLQYTDSIATTGLLDVATGEATSLSEVVTGDRAVLLWYWAPH